MPFHSSKHLVVISDDSAMQNSNTILRDMFSLDPTISNIALPQAMQPHNLYVKGHQQQPGSTDVPLYKQENAPFWTNLFARALPNFSTLAESTNEDGVPKEQPVLLLFFTLTQDDETGKHHVCHSVHRMAHTQSNNSKIDEPPSPSPVEESLLNPQFRLYASLSI
ncbi:hypothetical protein BJ165DRAFT_1611620 [Panaeolus papilionaceus]|nr:hypothetical protein BJ165DRAFT_1611620 [Panaeolus papilionaceus]